MCTYPNELDFQKSLSLVMNFRKLNGLILVAGVSVHLFSALHAFWFLKKNELQRFQFHMLGVGQEFSCRNIFFWCQRLPMYENYFLGWSLDMTSTCLEHKTRIAQAESRIGKESYFLKGIPLWVCEFHVYICNNRQDIMNWLVRQK